MANPTSPKVETNGTTTRPQTPRVNSFALTEYTANPTPPPQSPVVKTQGVPEHFLLPNGYPDVMQPFRVLRRCL